MKKLPAHPCISNFLVIFLFFFSKNLAAQYVPVPAPPQAQPILVRGATAHIGNGQVIENSLVAFEKGKFTYMGQVGSKNDFPNHLEIDATGQHLYPGFIAPNTTLGLAEIDQVRATRDDAEIGELNPNIRSLIAYNTDSEVTPTVRSMGVLTAEIVPQGGRIAGTSSLVVLDAWNWEDAAYKADLAIHLNWPAISAYSWRERRRSKNEKYDEQVREVEDFFRQAQAYFQKDHPAVSNLRFEAMNGLFSGEKRLFVHADDVQAIQDAVLLAREFSLTPTIVGGRDAWMIVDFLKKHQVAIILGSTQSLPGRDDEDIDQPFKTPAMLQQAGLLWCFSHTSFWQQRNLAFQAGQAVSFGLAYEDAVRALTSNTARIFGIGDAVGTIETGKDATFFLCQGDVLDMRTSKLTRAFIQGRDVSLDNKQEMLYRRFQEKYKER
ncbi:MAG: amidohydrolase family protein [Saprospiraceae bacterium]